MTDETQAHLTAPVHAAYATEDHAVWREALIRHTSFVARYGEWMHPAYLGGLRALALSQRIPSIEEINERLTPTGWKAVCVAGCVPTAALTGLLSARTVPLSRHIRRFEHIDHAPGPDIVHDVFGHLPMLFSAEYRAFLARMAGAMAKAAPCRLDDDLWAANQRLSELRGDPRSAPIELAQAEAQVLRARRRVAADPSERTRLERMYLWSVEFGLLGTVDDFRVHGAAVLSSPAEFRALCTRAVRPSLYSIEVIDRDYAFTELQAAYYVARDFAQLHDVLGEYEADPRHRRGVRTIGGPCSNECSNQK